MLWFSTVVMFGLTTLAWWNAQQLKGKLENAGLRKAYIAATVCGAIGTLCFFFAALI
jgi:hypothetical protein